MKQPGLDQRHRDIRMVKLIGNTATRSSRRGQTYGRNFAPGIAGDKTLREVLHILDEPSLSQLIRDLHR